FFSSTSRLTTFLYGSWARRGVLETATCPADALYLPVDPAADAPNVAAQEADPESLMNTVKALLRLRHEEEDLQADGEFEVLYAKSGKLPFVYRRGDLILALNPSGKTVSAPVDTDKKELRFAIGSGEAKAGKITLQPQSFLVLK
ncbi:MAG: DUF3459 domain-containing protein, partial [Lachnospiraceae bacterium]|nr:DUF3459 domain-containing protein [Lachnospiraceae bacterium]